MTEQEQSSVNSLTAALLKASGESTTVPAPSNRPTPAERSKANLRRIHAEEQGQCPKCGYTAPLDDFDDGDSSESDGLETDEEAGKTDGDDNQAEANLAKALLKSANASQAKQTQGLKSGPALTEAEATKLIQAALKNLRR